MAAEKFKTNKVLSGVTNMNLLALCLITTLLIGNISSEPQTSLQIDGTPDLETFATYEDMRRYFANRNLRSLRYLDNPNDDSYIDAFNKHNEQTAELDFEKLQVLHKRTKRTPAATEHKMLPNEPTLLKFEISDAVEPSDEVKAIIREHRGRELKSGTNAEAAAEAVKATITTPSSSRTSSTATTTATTTVTKKRIRKGMTKTNTKTGEKSTVQVAKRNGRTKRAALQQHQQPTGFKVKFIPFEVSDAREPDDVTKSLIKRMRALEHDRLQRSREPQGIDEIVNKKPTQTLNKNRRIKPRRTRRAAPQTRPEMFKFELTDAKEPDESMKQLLSIQQKSREGKQLKPTSTTVEHKEKNDNLTSTAATTAATTTTDQTSGDLDDSDDQSSHESKRFYVYKEAPPKPKKSLNSLPQDVQKVITHLLKEHSGGKAYLKYIPTQQMDYSHLKSYYPSVKLQQPVYGTKLQPPIAYAKFAATTAPKVEIHSVPVVEKVRYVYSPSQPYKSQHYSTQPIIVPEVTVTPSSEIHHTYAADLSHIHDHIESAPPQAIKSVPAPQFRPSKPDPTLDENKLAEEYAHSVAVTPLPIEHLKYELYSYGSAPQSYSHAFAKPHIHLLSQQHPELEKLATATAPVIKIEYHATPDALKENYKELREFKELSSLMGKSPEDQIHGLTYLLAKEMQTKLQRQSKNLEQQRPQDNTSPILFHPKQAQMALQQVKPLGVQPGRLIGMAKVKEYIPIVEHTASSEQAKQASDTDSLSFKHSSEEVIAEKESATHQLLEYGGLSPNYEVIHAAKAETLHEPKLIVEQIVHHPSVIKHHGIEESLSSADVKFGAGLKLSNDLKYGVHLGGDDDHALQYASKYAFGYRIRDFHTGNDFGHKQNRDLDGVTRGQYHILLPDGRIQNVIYHADDTGFHADVSFESGH